MNQRSNCQHPLDHRKRKIIPEKISTSASLTMLKPLTVQFSSVTQSYPTLCDPMEGSTPVFPVHLIVWITSKLWEILQEMGIPDYLTCLLRNLYAVQEATVRTRYGTTDWFQIGKGVCQGCILSPCLFNLYAEYIMWNTGLYEAQTGIQIARRNINNLSYADDTILMGENKGN